MKPRFCEKYAAEIPEDVTQIIASLDDTIRQAILVLLTKNDELPFSELQNRLGISKLTLNYHLKNLYSAGLTDHYFRHELGSTKYSYYAITNLGKRVLSKLIEALVPPPPFQKMKSEETSEDYVEIPTVDYSCQPAAYIEKDKEETVKIGMPVCTVVAASKEAKPTDTTTYS
jgi:DNA-binding transcriptional ArsR family regulator